MKAKTFKKVTSLALVGAMTASLFAGCGSDSGKSSTAKNSKHGGPYEDFITVDVYDSQANFQGIQSGWFAKVVKDKFNMELNIIAPNVAGGGDTLYQTRSANGNLGDLIIINADKSKLKDMVQADLLYDMTDLIKDCDNLSNYSDAIKTCSELAGKDGTWAVPSEITQGDPTEPSEASDPTNAPSLRWDVYKEIGYPQISTLEDLLDVGEQMQQADPTSDSGKQTYMFSWFKDWDGDTMQNATGIAALYGYRAVSGFAFGKSDGSDVQSAIDSDSIYVRALKFMYEANKRGLVDPESTTQNFDTLASKYTDGQVLYSLWPWLGSGYYNTADNIAAGKGFQSAVIDDMQCLGYGGSPLGKMTNAIMIGSKAQDPQRLADFIDWLYSPEGVEMSATQTGGSCGPEGLTWEMGDDGQPKLTDFGVKAFVNIDDTLQVPDDWGGGTWKDGISALNYKALGITAVNQENGMCYNYQTWADYLEKTASPLSEDWAAHFGVDKTTTAIDYLDSVGKIITEPGTNYAVPEYSTDIATIKEQCAQVILEKSWQMAFASSDDEFNSLLKDMQDTCKGLGYDQVYEIDKENCQTQFDAFNDSIASAAGESK
ncbi:MAG: extracellular solute-binding protein [[Eubacterium] rectale]|nr:extracellular solute-binding protein [Agathobacter rectalis]